MLETESFKNNKNINKAIRNNLFPSREDCNKRIIDDRNYLQFKIVKNVENFINIIKGVESVKPDDTVLLYLIHQICCL